MTDEPRLSWDRDAGEDAMTSAAHTLVRLSDVDLTLAEPVDDVRGRTSYRSPGSGRGLPVGRCTTRTSYRRVGTSRTCTGTTTIRCSGDLASRGDRRGEEVSMHTGGALW